MILASLCRHCEPTFKTRAKQSRGIVLACAVALLAASCSGRYGTEGGDGEAGRDAPADRAADEGGVAETVETPETEETADAADAPPDIIGDDGATAPDETAEALDAPDAGDPAGDPDVTEDARDAGGEEAWTMPPRPDTSRPAAGDSWRYGGGAGYPDMVDPAWPVVTVVRTRAQLTAALAAASAGSIVYVDDDAAIDLTGASLCIPGGAWLAGGRGRDGSPGGLLFTTVTVKIAMLKACGDGVRVTGLRILGADPDQCPPEWPDACTGDIAGDTNCRDCTPASYGVTVNGWDRLEVDNCELAGWSFAATSFADGTGHLAHHNHIHHTQRQGLGYGVVLGGGLDEDSAVRIEWNRFDYNRHAVAASGYPRQDYEALHNLVLAHANGHVFDMHGMNEHTHDGSVWAGRDIRVHHNTVLVADQYSFVVRGRPATGAWLWDNCLARSSASAAAAQRNYFGNFHVDASPTGPAPNDYGRSAGGCETVRWCVSAGGAGPWRYGAVSTAGLASLAFGDFDGDGVDDVFTATGSEWRWSRSGTAAWARLNTMSAPLSSLAFGDFDGDRRTDVFTTAGGEWRWSRSGAAAWARLNASTVTLPSLAFGDFDGDGRTDVFTATGTEWRWSRSGAAPLAHLNTSGTTLAQLAFGDFDGDGRTDVFWPTGTEWRWSRSGGEAWARLNTSSSTLASIVLGDFDGDNRTDVLSRQGNRWMVAWAGRGGWEQLRIASEPPAGAGLGDFDGDGATDVFMTGCL